MSSHTSYTELETLLLFQALRAEGASGITPNTFNSISEQLKNIPLICNDSRYDGGGRLSPDALRELYLSLLKTEAKLELERQNNHDTHLGNGSVSPGSRKRKAPSPSFPTVREAQQHSHLIPQLVSRLYGRYREYTVQRLQHHEKKYAEIKQEVVDLQAGHQDQIPQHRHPISQSVSPKLSPKPSSSAHTQSSLSRDDHVKPETARVAASPSTELAGETNTTDSAKRFSQAKIEAVINHDVEMQDTSSGPQGASPSTSLHPVTTTVPQPPQAGGPPKVPNLLPQPIQPAPSQGYVPSPSVGHQSPYAPPHAPSRPASVTSPQVQQSLTRPSSSPRPILPPPKGMPLPPRSSSPHLGSPVSHTPTPSLPPHPFHQGPAPQHYQIHPRMLPGSAPSAEGTPRAYPTALPASQPPGYYQQQQSPYGNPLSSYSAQHVQQMPPYSNQAPHHPGSFMVPNYSIPSQESQPLLQQARPQHTPIAPQRTHLYHQPPYNAPATGPRHILPQPSRLVSDVVAALATPPRPRIKPLWKSDYPAHIMPTPRPRPEVEPLSPTLERAKVPVRSTRNTRGQQTQTGEDQQPAEPMKKVRASKRNANNREKSPHSVVSSTADESLRTYTRSQSVSTAVGANPPSDDRPGSVNEIKPDPSTPANDLDDVEQTANISATPTSGMMTRKRRGTAQSQPQPPAKRKRQESPRVSAEDPDPAPAPSPRRNTVVAARNFAKMSSAVMNDITSHKHASYFAKEVRDKDAPGYGDIVYQPQNLKAIRSAITAGARAITAASSSVDSPSGTNSGSTAMVELERTIDLIPPKAIVNGAQLEKELMRMFANAYLFNPGEDGMALSTHEMFEDVEQKIAEWRGTERDAGRDATAEEDEEVKGKRRKL